MGRVGIGRDDLRIAKVWLRQSRTYVSSSHVSKLRKKLGHQVNGVERIKTVRGVGYIYAP